MSAPVGPRNGVNLIDDCHAEVAEEAGLVDARRNEHYFERFRRGHQQLCWLTEKSLALVIDRVPMPNEPA